MPTYILYKPFNMLSQFTKEVPQHITLADLDFNFPKDVYPVGRLDADSEGLLLLTNNKQLNAQLLNPKSKQPKTYYLQVEGQPTDADLTPLRKGIPIKIKGKTHLTRPAKVAILPTIPDLPPRNPPVRFRKTVPDTWLEITLTEGKNRQVRRMFAAIGFPVLRLVRVRLAGFELGKGSLKEMVSGQVVELEKFLQ
ncbi:MAG: pseudouridine synthase [Bacteroidota bacterium]